MLSLVVAVSKSLQRRGSPSCARGHTGASLGRGSAAVLPYTTSQGHPSRPAPFAAVTVAHHLVGREESVLDALLERVGVDGIPEVVAGGDLRGFLGRGGQTELGRSGKVIQDFAPGRIGGGAAAVALVHDNEVEEIGRELLEDVFRFLSAGDGLVQGQV